MHANASSQHRELVGHWVWLFPVGYLIHVAEEYWAGEGFPSWASRFSGVEVTETYFVRVNSIAWLLMVVGIILILKLRSFRWLLIAFGTTVLINGVLHLLGTLASRSYSPGLVSGLLVWIPLGVFTLQRARHSVKPKIFWRGLAVGVVIHAFVIVLTFFERISAG